MFKFLTIIAASMVSGFLWADDAVILPQTLVKALQSEKYMIVDVRTEEEFRQGHIKGALWVPHQQAERVVTYLNQSDKTVVIYCRSGRRSRIAAKNMQKRGLTRPVLFLEGDYPAWEMFGYPTLQGLQPAENLRLRAKGGS